MSTILLIRHGNTDVVGRILTGRSPGVHLNEEGRSQAEQLAERLSPIHIDLLCSSPLERACETAGPLAREQNLAINICEEFTEFDTGEWTGREIADLEPDPTFRYFNSFRTGTRIPGGEHVLEVQKRMVDGIERIRSRIPHGVIAIVSHADPIKTALAYYAGMQLDSWNRISVNPASVSILIVENHGARLHCLNHTGSLPL